MSERHQPGGSASGAGTELRGTIKWFNPEKGYGFVSPADGSQDVFLHISALKQAGLQDAPEGSTIHCEVGQGRKGVQVLRVIALDQSTATPRQATQAQRPPRRPFPPRGNSSHHGHE
jgi:CspA family cold shock protein